MADADVDTLDALLKQMEAAASGQDAATYHELNARFHLTLYHYCPNLTIRDLIAQLWRKTLRYRAILAGERGRIRRSLRAHLDLMGAVRARDAAGAERIMRKMTETAGAELARILRDRRRITSGSGIREEVGA
jgi:DNA-binding GntR family transcriptional regulator